MRRVSGLGDWRATGWRLRWSRLIRGGVAVGVDWGGYLHRADIPPPTPQVLIVTEEGDFYGDLGWPEFGLIIEFDGLGKYQTAQDVRAEKFREQSLRRAGWRVERFLWHDVVDDPAGFVEVVRRLLREQGWRG